MLPRRESSGSELKEQAGQGPSAPCCLVSDPEEGAYTWGFPSLHSCMLDGEEMVLRKPL